jgi:hypothetical protein
MKRHGSCLCGAVTYEVDGPMREVVACHCIQCRKQTGHYLAMTNAKVTDFHLLTSAPLKWYRASDAAKRGFCGDCGSVLFWQGDGSDEISISAGSIDGQTGLKLGGHIFCDFAGDYYEIVGGDYQRPEA